MTFTNKDRERATRTEQKVEALHDAFGETKKDFEERLRKIEGVPSKITSGIFSGFIAIAASWFMR